MHIKIGTRKSKLALWQANHVAKKLEKEGCTTELILIISEGDIMLDKPLPLIGGKGIFTKVLDNAILDGKIDIAVHSLKDIPTQIEEKLTIAAVLKRINFKDTLVCRKGLDFLQKKHAVIATSSTRRKAQWLNKYPNHHVIDIRGNVPTRIKKLKNSDCDATILAAAGLIRLDLQHEISKELDWMIPAPAQGAIGIVSSKKNTEILKKLKLINDKKSSICTKIERDFLNTLNGGCSSPVGAHAYIQEDQLIFHGVILSYDGTKKIKIELSTIMHESENLGKKAADIALKKGAKKLISQK